ncbi:MAG: diguanylate cyclase [Piscinibacter sp.]|uniref:sensor domain-containing diguanylate cyclase n=1 Tax=Piscinibacter sp. TaxID=1903157 RepID=UPI003D125782
MVWTRLTDALGSIKLRLTLASVVALAVGVVTTTLLLVQRAERDLVERQRDQQLVEVVNLAHDLSARVVERQEALRLSAAQIDVSMLRDERRLRFFLDNKPLMRAQFANVFVAKSDGSVVVVADPSGIRRPDVNLADREYFRRTLAERRAIVSEPVMGRVSAEPVVMFTHPLVDGTGELYGVLGGALRLVSHDLLGESDHGAMEGDELKVITDAQGRMITHPMHRQLLQPLSVETRLVDAFANWKRSGAPVEPSGLLLHQEGEVITLAGVPGPDWVVWRAVPESTLLGPLHSARREALSWAIGLIAVLSLALLAVQWWLLRPLGQLQSRALHLFDGSQAVHDGWPEGAGEIGSLGRVLRHVAAERAQLESFNDQVMRKLSSVMAAAPVGICFTRDKNFILVSDELCRLLGRSEAELLGQPASLIYASNEDYQRLGPQVLEAFSAQRPYVGEWQMLRADGSRFWGQLRGRPVTEGDPSAGTIWTLADISEQVASREQLEWSATHDALTGLANRKLFAQRLARVVEALPRSLPAELVMIDLDHFKPINDRAGHAAGDAMLKAVAAAITSRVRATDLVVRLGGDEFALLLERCPHDNALHIAENVRLAIVAIELAWEGQTLRVGASLGVASLTPELARVDDWLAAADAACYAAKAAGRGAVHAAQAPKLRVVR